jgi:hypothetical protein
MNAIEKQKYQKAAEYRDIEKKILKKIEEYIKEDKEL